MDSKLKYEWYSNKNDKPFERFSYGSNYKAYWKCLVCGNIWQATIKSRNQGRGCPYCAHKIKPKDTKPFAQIYPLLAKEWFTQENESVTLDTILPNSNRVVFWKCQKCGFVWKSRIVDRVKGSGCPQCSKDKKLNTISNESEIQLFKELIEKEWHPIKNLALDPKNLTYGSSHKVWWKCKYGHEWKASVNSRTQKKTSCPYCSGKKFIKGYNDFATTYPNLLITWDYSKNDIQPNEVSASSKKKIWWKCKYGHEWNTSIYMRTKLNSECPICKNKM